MDKYDTSQLTEFPRFESETNQSGVSNFFNKIWKFPLFSPSETTENLQSKAQVEEKKHGDLLKEDKEEEVKTETGAYAVEYEGRSLQNVLKRISSLVALGSGGGTRYADTELARYWMPDDISRECYECATRFSTLRRRHHCRVCGQIFCSRCCSQRVPGQIFGCADVLRVCKYCCNVVLSYLKENEMSGEISPDLKTLQENLQVKFPENKSQQLNQGWDNFMFAREHEDRSEMRTSPKEDLQDVFRQLSFSLPTQQHRYRLVRYNGVWRGCDILQWIMENTSNKTRAQAGAVCAALLGAGHMQCTAGLPHFADYALYQPAPPPPPPAAAACDDRDRDRDRAAEQPSRMASSASSYCLDLNVDDKSARLTRATKTEIKSSSSEEENPVIEPTEVSEPGEPGEAGEAGEPSRLCGGLARRGEEHLRHLMRQCLARQALPAAWLPVLYPLCCQAAERVVPAAGGDMDVRSYVQVKKLPGGAPADCALLDAVVLTKNVAHRGMPQQISKPTVLLLDCSIAYQRVEGKHTSLEPVLMQEQEYLSRCAARITALRPSVVLCGGRCARGVQDALRAAGVALATHVRAPALRRAARCTRADTVASVDARIATPRLGLCEQFYVRNYSGKTLMVLEGCAEPNLGCCILLRGASTPELVRVKRVVRFMLLACYNWKLERAFLADIEAVLPEPGAVFDDENIAEENETSDKKDNTEVLKILLEKSKEQRDVVESIRNEAIEADTTITNDEKLKDASDAIKESSDNTQIKAEIDDPLLRAKSYTRKTDSDKNPSCGVPIKDFSDPLHSTLSMEDDVFQCEGEDALKADAQSDRWCADDVALSMSPSVAVAAPYLETEAGRRCRLRRLFPRPLLPPPAPCAPRPRPRPRQRPPRQRPAAPARIEAQHPFVRAALQGGAEAAAALAHFRATGGARRPGDHRPGCALHEPPVFRAPPPPPPPPADGVGVPAGAQGVPVGAQGAAPDPYAPESHQQLSALLYSYSSKSPNAPDFCVNPWVVTMEMYGRHDISLGAFLDKFCFDPRLPCSSDHCSVPVNQHVRKFVHGDACITITCNTVGRSGVDKAKEDHTKQVMFWSRCERCGCSGRARRLSRGALALSLALYLRARLGAGAGAGGPGGGAGGPGGGAGAGAPVLLRGGCAHPLHAHAHAFVCNSTTAYFRHSAISPYSIQLPPDVIATRYDVRRMRDALIASLNELMHRGHETLSNVPEGEAERDYQGFRAHTEQIHLALTAAGLLEHASVAAAVRSLWDVSDRIIFAEKMLREAQERWASPAPAAPVAPAAPATKPPRPQADTAASEEKSDLEDSNGDANSDSTGTTYVFATDTPKEVEIKEHASTEEDEEKGDKKTVRQILSQLLSNNRPSNENGMIISSGLVPVVVLAGEIGSVIAATLASVTYQRTLRAQLLSSQSEQDEAEAPGAPAKDKVDGDKSKAKSNDHIEVLLKDGLACRVYYAQQFHRLRHMLLAPAGADADAGAEAGVEAGAGAGSARCGCDDTKDKSDLPAAGRCLCAVEEGFLRSLAHCVPWAARGGKSGSTFCKTKDDRYVLKEMTKPEWQQFLEFAPHYFSYVTSCRQRGQPSLLARILGVYSVGGAGVGVLVVEHVWYECGAAPRYDLKGTARGRAPPPPAHAPPHAAAPPADPDVLLDDNLLALRWERPLWVRGHAARALWAALARDTRFLADSCVMDYSLLLALRGGTLVLGIIDYIRTFTWDKRLEHLVKKNLGGGQPTVVSPEEYRRRFRRACRKYFLQCPGPWDHLYDTTHP